VGVFFHPPTSLSSSIITPPPPLDCGIIIIIVIVDSALSVMLIVVFNVCHRSSAAIRCDSWVRVSPSEMQLEAHFSNFCSDWGRRKFLELYTTVLPAVFLVSVFCWYQICWIFSITVGIFVL